MKYGCNVYKTEVEGHVFWVAESKDLKGCVGQGETAEEALSELETNEEEWLDAAKECGIPIPDPSVETMLEYSGKFMTRVSPKVHKEAVENAKKEGLSLNQYVNNAIIVANTSKTTIGAIGEILNDFKEMLGNGIVEAYGYNTIQYSLETQETGLNMYSLRAV